MSWRPLAREPTPLDEAVNAAIRATILPAVGSRVPPPDAEGVRVITLPDGRVLRIALRAEPSSRAAFGKRDAAFYAVSGNCVLDTGVAAERRGYALSGQAVVDIATRAFLHVEHRLETVGAIPR